jgi:hypothetical protein
VIAENLPDESDHRAAEPAAGHIGGAKILSNLFSDLFR